LLRCGLSAAVLVRMLDSDAGLPIVEALRDA
jgi:hypothetical protein